MLFSQHTSSSTNVLARNFRIPIVLSDLSFRDQQANAVGLVCVCVCVGNQNCPPNDLHTKIDFIHHCVCPFWIVCLYQHSLTLKHKDSWQTFFFIIIFIIIINILCSFQWNDSFPIGLGFCKSLSLLLSHSMLYSPWVKRMHTHTLNSSSVQFPNFVLLPHTRQTRHTTRDCPH